MRQAIIFTAIVVTGAVLGANVYNSVVDVPNWGAQIPGSLETARRYFGVRNPGTFFRVASPLSQALSVLVLIVSWKLGGPTRGLAALALGLGVLADVFTFAYFYPRNDVMFVQAVDIDAMTRSWIGWSRMNHGRNLLVLGGLVCQLSVLWRVARATN
jgi:hypothetical protein